MKPFGMTMWQKWMTAARAMHKTLTNLTMKMSEVWIDINGEYIRDYT